MHNKIRIVSWNDGLDKISLTHFFKDRCGLGLAAAKTTTDRILKGECVEVDIEGSTEEDLKNLRAIGVNLEVV